MSKPASKIGAGVSVEPPVKKLEPKIERPHAPDPKKPYKWTPEITHKEAAKNPRYQRINASKCKVFNLEDPQDAQDYANVKSWVFYVGQEHGYEKSNVIIRDEKHYPPSPGKSDVRVFLLWWEMEYVVLDKLSGLPQS
jgi:hypothetical protein